jgi:hypothetical protein
MSQNYMLRGTVTDAKTKEALVGVSVVIKNYNFGATTDETGLYEIQFQKAGDYIIELSYVGYKTLTVNNLKIRSSKPLTINVEMEEDIFSSDVVEVRGSYFTSQERIEVSTLNLSQEEIRRFPGGFEDVVRTVSTLPGVSINVDQGRNDLLVRGGGPSENLFIVNNIEIPNINHFGTQGGGSGSLSYINLDFIEDVRFSTGGFSAQYGDKLSSVLNLDLTEGRRDRFGGKATLAATQLGLNLEGPISDKSSYLFSIRKSYLDWIFKASGVPFVPVYSDINFIYNQSFENNNKLSFISFITSDHTSKDLTNEENRVFNAALMNNRQQQFVNGVNYRHMLSKGYLDLTANVNVQRFKFSQDDQNVVQYFKNNSEEVEYITKAQYFHQFSKRFAFRTGAQFKAIENNSTTAFADTVVDRSGNRVYYTELGLSNKNLSEGVSATKYSLFTEVDLTFGNLEVLLGLRLDHYGFINEKNYLVPRVNAKYALNNRTSIKASAGRYAQAPSYVWVQNPSNKDLVALKNDMFVLGIEHYLSTDLKLSFEAYTKRYSDLPTGAIAGVNDYLVLTNTGAGFGGRGDNFGSFGYQPLKSAASGKAYGFEFFMQKKYSDTPYYGQLSLSYNKSDVTAGNGNVYPTIFDQRFIFNLSGGYKFSERWEASGKFRFYSGRPFTPIYNPSQNGGNLQNIPDEYLSDRLANGHQLDVRVDRFAYYENFTLIYYLDIQNVYNQEQPRPDQFDFYTNDFRESRAVRILPSIGISFEF